MSENEWSVDYSFRSLPDEDWLMRLQVDLDDAEVDGAVSAVPGADTWTVGFGVHAASPDEAWHIAAGLVEKFGLDAYPIAGLEVLTLAELERRADAPTMPRLVGASEVADMLHVTRQRVHQLRSHPGFPMPLVEVAMGPLWDERAVAKFNRVWDRKPGRRRTAVA